MRKKTCNPNRARMFQNVVVYIYIQRTKAYVASCRRTSVLILAVRYPIFSRLRIFTSSFEEKENGLVCGLYWPYQLLTSS